MKYLILRTWLGALLSLLGFFSPVAKATLPEPGMMRPATAAVRTAAVKPSIKKAVRDINGMNLHANERAYSYVFTGKALLNGQPSANTKVLVQLTTEDTMLAREATTGADGGYTLTVPITGEPYESVRWDISAVTPEMKKASTQGYQILMDETELQQSTLLNVF